MPSTSSVERLAAPRGRARGARPRGGSIPVVEALQALRGVQWHRRRLTVVAELGDLTRFDNPRQLASLRRAHALRIHQRRASGGRAGSPKPAIATRARALIEGAWAYRYPARSPRTSSGASTSSPSPSRTSAGKPRCASANATAGSSLAASTPTSSPYRHRPRAARLHVGHRQGGPQSQPRNANILIRPCQGLGRGAAPVLAQPSRRYEAAVGRPSA